MATYGLELDPVPLGLSSSAALAVLGEYKSRPEILRGARMSTVLQGMGTLWRTSPVDLPVHMREGLWSKSTQCEAIDAFISQTWMTSGIAKYLALLLRFYWAPALGAGLACSCIFVVLDVFGELPTFGPIDVARVGISKPLHLSPWAPLPPMVTLLALVMAPKLPGLKDRTVFFDAVCINQVDEDLKKAGVKALGGFVASSREMIILWCENYFRRALCMFELSIFVALRSDGKIHVIPTFIATMISVGFSTFLAWVVLFTLVDYLSMDAMSSTLFWSLRIPALLPVPYFVHRLRLYSLAVQKLDLQFAHFRLDDAKCREDSDFSFIKDSVETLYGSKEQFELFVRTSLRRKVLAFKGTHTIRLKHCVLIVSPLFAYGMQLATSYVRAGASMGAILVVISLQGSYALILSATIRVCFQICKRHAKQHPNIIVNCLCSTGIAVLMFFVALGSGYALSAVSKIAPWGPVLGISLGPIVACIYFRPVDLCMSGPCKEGANAGYVL